MRNDKNQGWFVRIITTIFNKCKRNVCIISLTSFPDYGLVSYDPNELLRGPAFVSQPESLVVVGTTIAASIECIATGNPRPKYKWFTGQNFETEVTPELSTRYTLTNGKLVLEKPAENEDADQYRCSVENEFGKILGNPIQISFGSKCFPFMISQSRYNSRW